MRKDLAKWRIRDDVGRYDMDGIIDTLYASLYNIDDPERSLTRDSIAHLIPVGQLDLVVSMIERVNEQSSPTLSEEEKRRAENDPN